MLPRVKITPIKISAYKGIISEKLMAGIKSAAKDLQGLRVNFVNSSPYGGGVAEILRSLVGLLSGVGLKAEWHIIPPDINFFSLTKELHNALQGKKFAFIDRDKRIYEEHMRKTAELMGGMKADIWSINDPQPAGVIKYLPELHPAIIRVHIDTTHPNRQVWNYFAPIFSSYDKIIFSSREFIHPPLPRNKIRVILPAIDVTSRKNRLQPLAKAKETLKFFGIDTLRPLISQISRFDPWKDPIGVIRAYRLAKKKIPGLQLALVGLFLATDDPEEMKVFKQVKDCSDGDPDIFIFTDPNKILGRDVDLFINDFQTASDVVLQKSIREGFGLTATEAMWKERPVIVGSGRGLKNQIKNGYDGFIASRPKQAADQIVRLIKHPELAAKIGKAGKRTVKEKFLMPRLLLDYLNLLSELIKK